MTAGELLRQAVDAARAGRKPEARELFLRVTEVEPRNELAWLWLTGLMDSLDDKIIACENVLTLNPANDKVKTYLAGLLRQQSQVPAPPVERETLLPVAAPVRKAEPPTPPDPLAQVEQLEFEGRIAEAIQAYEQLAATTRDTRQFDYLYRQIVRLEALQHEKIRFVSPRTSILRMTFTWPLLYFSFALLEVGLNPFANLSFFLWLGLPIVGVGSFLLAVADVRSRHPIWEKVFLETGTGSRFARTALATAGWVFILIPFALMIISALARLQELQIPPEPFFR